MQYRRLFAVLGLSFLVALSVTATSHAADFYDPVGTDDRADCSRLAGWAKDGDTTAPILVAIYKDAPYPSGSFVGYVTADKYRADLPFTDKNHGYDMPTPSAFFTGCPTRAYLYAIDSDENGNPVFPASNRNNKLLNNTGKLMTCGTPNPACAPQPDKPVY